MRSDHLFDLVVLDEAQRIKNAGSLLSLACKMLPRRRSWALTGTPVENVVEDLLAIFSFLSPGLLRVHMPRSQMHKTIQPFFLRRRKRDVLGEMPPINIQDIPLELEGEQRAAYEDVWNERKSLIEGYGMGRGASEAALLTLLTRLKQLCNFDPDSGTSAKMDVLEGVVEEAIINGTKCLIFSQYVETLRFIAARLPGKFSIFHGGLPESERASIVANFEAETSPCSLLISLKAGGVGLNLNSASLVVMFDRWWNPAVENQAITRAHRFGKAEPLQVIRFVVKDTIEERIASILEEKSELFEQYVEAADNWTSTSITGPEMRKILQVS